MNALRWLGVLSSGLAAFAWIGLFDLPGGQELACAFYCAVACLALLVVGLLIFRSKALWLAIPSIIAIAAPVWFVLWFGTSVFAGKWDYPP